jgi:putative ABC transport system permease protein
MIRETFRIAVFGLVANKARSFLTMLGILIGVMAVILLLAVGRGASGFVQNQVAAFGVTSIEVFPQDSGDSGATRSRSSALNDTDLEALRDASRAPSIVRAAPTVAAQVTVAANGRTHRPRGEIVGTSDEFLAIRNRVVVSGTGFTPADVTDRRRVAVIGPTVRRRLFGTADPVGQTLKLGDAEFEIIGVLDRRGSSFGFDLDDTIVTPITAMTDAVTGRGDGYTSIVVQGRSRDVMPQVSAEVRAVLYETRQITDPTRQDFGTFEPSQQLQTANQISLVFTLLLGAVAGISLVVGGIGVMNIMLVTVTERTREIGTRKAVGARRWHLTFQFLVESSLLAAAGGVIGIALGVGLAQIPLGAFRAEVTPASVIGAFAVSLAIGVFFGAYPASRAAKLRPIDALRYE